MSSNLSYHAEFGRCRSKDMGVIAKFFGSLGLAKDGALKMVRVSSPETRPVANLAALGQTVV